ncbi:hypothetical protein L7F22_064641 [Adiantum nelumboides]|nr:hypothetical protein [Adiantum nelumboides]
MPQFSFYQVDVFTSKPTLGNPVAVVVVPRYRTLSQQEMQGFARWTNLSETTFLFETEDDESSYDYHLRIFTPNSELPFAGHPTLGSCQAWLHHGGRPRREARVVQQCGIGSVEIAIEADGSLSFAAPPLTRSGPVEDSIVERACMAMGITKSAVLDAQWIVNGPTWFALRLASANDVLGVELGGTEPVSDLMWGIFGPYIGGQAREGEPAFEVRAFAPGQGVKEDPVCGSFNAGLALSLQRQSQSSRSVPATYVISQGARLGREGRIIVRADEANGTTWIGGHAIVCISGQVNL